MTASVTPASSATPLLSPLESQRFAPGRSRALALALLLVLSLGACERRPDSSPISGDASKVVMASPGPSSSNPLPGVIPLEEKMPAPKSNSPADGTTAVGGLTSNSQGSGGGATGGTPAKTGGDGK